MIIYKITNNVNQKVYVGKTTKTLKDRINGHIDYVKYSRAKDSSLLHKAMKKYGVDNFTIEIIDNAKTENELNKKEIGWIKKLNSKAPNGYNLTDGGEGWCGAHHTNEAKRKIASTKIGKAPWNKGKTGIYSQLTKDSIAKNVQKSQEVNGKTKKVMNETTGEVFVSIREAARHYNVNNSTILRACHKIVGKSKVKNCYWRYADDEESIWGEIKREKTNNLNTLVSKGLTKIVKNITTGEIFESLHSAARAYNVYPTSIAKGCNKGYTIKGCKWEYIDKVIRGEG